MFVCLARRRRRFVAGRHRAGNWRLVGRDEYSSVFLFFFLENEERGESVLDRERAWEKEVGKWLAGWVERCLYLYNPVRTNLPLYRALPASKPSDLSFLFYLTAPEHSILLLWLSLVLIRMIKIVRLWWVCLWSDLNPLIYQTIQIYPSWAICFVTIFSLFTPLFLPFVHFFWLKLFSLKFTKIFLLHNICLFIYLLSFIYLLCFALLFYFSPSSHCFFYFLSFSYLLSFLVCD